MDDYEKQLNEITEAQKKKNMQDLEAARNSSLTEINREDAVAKPKFTQQRADKNAASQIQKLNFAEYYQNRGQQGAGIANQAELSRGNVLARNIGEIDTAENTYNTDMANRRADINTNYNTSLASSNLGIDTNKATQLLAYREQLRQEKLARDEQLRQEEEQRKAATLAYQRSLAKSSTSSSSGFADTATNNQVSIPEVRNIGNNTIAVKKPNGEYATFTITSNTPNATILKWGQANGVDLSAYVS